MTSILREKNEWRSAFKELKIVSAFQLNSTLMMVMRFRLWTLKQKLYFQMTDHFIWSDTFSSFTGAGTHLSRVYRQPLPYKYLPETDPTVTFYFILIFLHYLKTTTTFGEMQQHDKHYILSQYHTGQCHRLDCIQWWYKFSISTHYFIQYGK